MIRWLLPVLLFALQAQALPANVVQITIEEAERAGLEPAFLLAVIDIESSGNCSAKTGRYRGALQLSDKEFEALGGKDITDCRDNIRVGTGKIAKEANTFREANGREPTAAELYLIHQQGPEGQAAHANHLDLPAWKSVWLWTQEGVSRGQSWSQAAVWGNVPSDIKPRFKGGVDAVTSRDFIGLWRERLEARMRKLLPPPPEPVEAYRCFVPAILYDKLRRESNAS